MRPGNRTAAGRLFRHSSRRFPRSDGLHSVRFIRRLPGQSQLGPLLHVVDDLFQFYALRFRRVHVVHLQFRPAASHLLENVLPFTLSPQAAGAVRHGGELLLFVRRWYADVFPCRARYRLFRLEFQAEIYALNVFFFFFVNRANPWFVRDSMNYKYSMLT